MARQVRGWDALRAWRFIRASRAYRDAWAKRLPMPGLPEWAPFPVHLQTAADLAGMAWGMATFEDPHAEQPLAPFWTRAGVIDGGWHRTRSRASADCGRTRAGVVYRRFCKRVFKPDRSWHASD